MLSVGVVGAGGVSYYFESVSSGVDDYYLAAEPGTWYGTGAEGLGLAGTIDGADLHAVLEGRHPTTGAPLGRAGKVAGFDLTFSAPKSVSVLAELGPPDVRTAVLAAHHAAVAGAVALLEEHALRGRRGHGGVSQVATAGAIAAGFDHHTSRAGDPQTHTHVLVANRAQGTDGVWGALYGQRVFAWAKTAGVAYQAFLRAELTAALGVGWGPVVNGMADLAALPAAVVDRFSTRRAQIVAELAARHREGPRAAQVAALATRPPKPEPLDPGTQRALWWDRAATAGFSPADLLEVLGPGRAPATLHPAGLAAELTAPAGLTGRRSGVVARHRYQAVAAAPPEGLDPKSLAALAAAVVAHPDVVSLPGRTLHAGATWTTAELAAAETAVMAGAARRLDAGVGVCPAAAVESALAARPSLSAEQQAMVRRLCCSGSGVDVVVGRPGTGKTFALDAARAAWETSGTAVVGAAVAARTARALEAGTAIPSTSLDSLLADLARPEVRLAPGTVIVVDEAGMVGTRPLARLLHGAEANHAKIVLTGDPAQLPELEAGGAFAALAKTLPAVELTVNRRQAHAWERAALDAVRAGTPAPAVAAYRQAGRLNFADTAEAARNALVADWAAAGDEGAAMVAMTRADVDDLNGLTRAHLVATGRLTA
ncbi:MAG TPA: MobF family relaxase, partial [Acidimicrobiales bacterium]|nr:MobF family relaxase [Acidimicrobiales bacterium]